MTEEATYHLARLSVSLPAELLEQLDAMVAERGLPSRSQMIAELIRHELAEHSAGVAGAVLAGTITLIYRAERGRVRQALAQTQSDFLKEVISSQHVFLEDDQSAGSAAGPGPLRAACRSSATACARSAACTRSTWSPPRALLPPLHAHAGDEDHYRQDA